MQRKPEIADSVQVRTIRFTWWASFLVTLVLIVALGVARSAQALTLPPMGSGGTPFTTLAADPEAEEESSEEEEFEAVECEVGEEEGEEEAEETEELCEAEEEAALEDCVLSSASASVSARTSGDRVRLAVRYTAFSPASVDVLYWLRGGKGPLSLGKTHERLGRQGVVRHTDTLTEAQMTKVLAAKSFTVQLRPAHAPRYCDPLLEDRLSLRHATPGALSWSDPEASFQISRRS